MAQYFNAVLGQWVDDGVIDTTTLPANNSIDEPVSKKPSFYDILIGLGSTAAQVISSTHGNPVYAPQPTAVNNGNQQQPVSQQTPTVNSNNEAGGTPEKSKTSTTTIVIIVLLILAFLTTLFFVFRGGKKTV